MQKFLIYIYSLITTLGFSQVNKTEIDSNLFAETYYRNHFFTFGPLYNTTESLIGLQIGNGNNEQPLIHFEDLSADILYKIGGQTDFNDNYSIDSEVSWNYPFKGKLSILSLNFNQSQFNDNQFFQRNIGLSSRYYLRFTSNLSVIAKLSHQRVNEQNNLGLGLGLQNGHQGIYYGIRVDYFDKYYNYSAYLQSLIFKSKLSIRLTHDRIDKYDYFNIGLNYIIIKTNANTVYN